MQRYCFAQLKRAISLELLVALIGAIGFVAWVSAEPTAILNRSLGPQFVARNSGVFSIISDSEAANVKAMLALANETRDRVEAFARSLDLPPRKDAATMTVVLFDDWNGYESFAKVRGFVVSESVPGFFDEASNRCYLFNFSNAALIRRKRDELAIARASIVPAVDKSITAAQREQRLTRIRKIEAQLDDHLQLVTATVVRHEIAHQVLWNLGIQRADQAHRRWLKEGLAMQFETVDDVNKYRLADWRSIDWSSGALSLRDVVSDATRIGPGAASPQQAYSASWGLVRYLIKAKPRELAAYIRATGAWEKNSADCVQGFDEAFGPLDAAFEKAVRSSVEAGS